MNLTRSIRRKLAVALGLLMLALVGFFVSSIVGLWDYRALVRDLETAINGAPRRSELLASIGRLAEPFDIRIPSETEVSDSIRRGVVERQRQALLDAIRETRTEVVDYFNRLDEFHKLKRVPISDSLERKNYSDRDRMLEKLALMESESGSMTDWKRQDASVVFVAKQLAQLNEIARNTPPPMAEVRSMLIDAHANYRLHFWMVSVAGAAASVLLISVFVLAARWVYWPIKDLHAVAKSVAKGDYNRRAKMCPSNDELSQLGHSINEMIERFQTLLSDRDREIHQRSQQLIQSARLADTGFLAAGIAHEVNNPLAGVGYAAESLQDRVRELLEVDEETGTIPEPDPRDLKVVNNYLDLISRETTRIRELTEKMKDFGRKDPGESQEERYRYDITAIVAEVISLIGHMKRYSDREIVFQPKEPLYAMVVSSQIKQVVLNLIANALDAVGSGGRLEIVARQCPDDVRLEFRDNGAGMDAKTLDHIFDPFYTTKLGENGTEKGTGLGLAISHRIVTDHDGTLEAQSAGPGQGSTFYLRLPRAKAARRAA